MATRRPRAETIAVDPTDPSGGEWRNTLTEVQPAALPEPEPAADESPADRIAVMLSDVRGDDRAKVKLLRIKPDARTEWCSDYTPAEFESGGFEMIRRDWGPGKYRVMLYAEGPSGNLVIRARDDILISDYAPTAKAKPNGGDDAITALGRLIVESNQRQAELITQVMNRPAPDMMQQLLSMATLMKELRGAFGGDTPAPRSGGNDPLTLIESMRAMREFAVELQTGKPAEVEKDPNADMMDLAKQVMAMIASMRNAPQGETAPALMPPVTLPPSVAEVPAAPEAPAPVAHEPETDPESAMLRMLFKSYMDTLIRQAETKAPVAETAQIVADKLPDMLVPMLDLPDWFDKLAAIDPRVIAHREYITQVRDAALPLLFEGDDSAA